MCILISKQMIPCLQGEVTGDQDYLREEKEEDKKPSKARFFYKFIALQKDYLTSGSFKFLTARNTKNAMMKNLIRFERTFHRKIPFHES